MNEEQWKNYFVPYVFEAFQRGIHPLQLLDEQWADGRTTATCVLPYISEKSRVLEIACGIGRVSRFVAPRCGSLYCTDILDDALTRARRNLQGCTNVVFKKINGYDLNTFEPDCFDCVYSFTTFFHFDFELVVNYFSEIKRVLKPGGIGVIEFKRWITDEDVMELLEKIEQIGGTQKYERKVDKWPMFRERHWLFCVTSTI
jgi:ubiquinone/menaquinone biosynthesis C-methylase UbiE